MHRVPNAWLLFLYTDVLYSNKFSVYVLIGESFSPSRFTFLQEYA